MRPRPKSTLTPNDGRSRPQHVQHTCLLLVVHCSAAMEKCLKWFFLVCCILVSVSAWKDCGSKGITLESVSTRDCRTGDPVCWAKKATNQTLRVEYTPRYDFSNLTVNVNASVGTFSPRTFPLVDGFVCNEGSHCPLKAGRREEVHFSYLLKKDFPNNVRVITYWYFYDDKKVIQGCLQLVYLVVKDT